MIESYILKNKKKVLFDNCIEICDKVINHNFKDPDLFALYGYIDLIKIFIRKIRLNKAPGMKEIFDNTELQDLITSKKDDRNRCYDKLILLKINAEELKNYLQSL